MLDLPSMSTIVSPSKGKDFYTIPQKELAIGSCHYYPKVSVRCSIVKEVFDADIEIYYEPEEYLLEVVSFDAWLASLKDEHFTVESLCREIFDVCLAALGDIRMSVTVTGTTTVHAPLQAIIYSEAFGNG